jgi:manganese/iron transport system permease protein
MIDPFFIQVALAGTLAGAGTGLLGAYVVGMRIPFIGICVAHAALAGAVAAAMLGWPMTPVALAAAVAVALLLGAIRPPHARADTNVIMSVLFSLTMGLAFLGIAAGGAARNDLLALMWGNVLLCSWRDVWLMAATTAVELAFVVLLYKELRAILFSRAHAASAGVRAGLVWTLLLIVICAVVTVDFKVVGGLMIYALLTNPAIAAFQVVRGCGRSVVLSAAFGAASGLGGFLISYHADLPTGAVIVIFSSALVGVCGLVGHWRRRGRRR